MMTEKPDFPVRVSKAYSKIRPLIKRTALEPSRPLSEMTGGNIFLKWESDQFTGSFKLRGVLNKLFSLSPEEKLAGVVSASTGNHGLALSFAAVAQNIDLKLFLPSSASEDKKRRIETLGIVPEIWGTSCEKTEDYAREYAKRTNRIFVSPYNDWEIILGAASVGLEILEDLPEVEDVVVPVGGGGLIGGLAGYLKSVKPGVRIVGVEPENSAFMAASIAAGRIVEIQEKATVADAVAGGIEPWSVTFPLCRDFVDRIVTVPEKSIVRAMALIYREHGKIVEGAGALPLAAGLEYPWLLKKRLVVLVVSGGNIAGDRFKELIEDPALFSIPDPWNQ